VSHQSPLPATPVPSAWNDTCAAFSHTATIPDLLRHAARRHPDRPAVVGPAGEVLTHGELDAWTEQLAGLFVELGVGPGSFVAVCSERTPQAVAALVAIIRSGAAYVPLDPAWPQARIRRLLSELEVVAVVAGRSPLGTLQELRWSLPRLRHVICPGIVEETTWAASFDPATLGELFDLVATDQDPLAAAGFNRGPRGARYERDDLATYQAHVAGLAARATGPGAKILEIGCGSGLIVDALAPTASRYVAVDLSEAALSRVRVSAAGLLPQVQTVRASAHEVAASVEGEFDLVILASTVQFFPDHEYLLTVLSTLAGRLRPGGQMLLADLIDPTLESHSGLRVSPAFFARLHTVLPGLSTAGLSGRAGTGLRHELAHRYDVLIQRDGAAPIHRNQTLWTAAHVARRERPSSMPEVLPDDPAYAIFTSGSTGAPKAVMVNHRAVVNLIEWMAARHGVTEQDRVLFVTSFCFDLSVYDIFGVLAAGGSVRIADERECGEPDALIDIIAAEPITLWDSAPATLEMLVPFLALRSSTPDCDLRLVLLSGDWVPLSLPDVVRARYPRVSVVALGGATECTVWSNHFAVGAVDPQWVSVPYGTPMQNAQYRVLEADLTACPLDAEGDLYISGECVAVGYVGASGLTASRFVADPWSPLPGKRMYRTGDRARWRPAGHLEFLGRTDDQVKIRGYRVELGEVQAALGRCPGIRVGAIVVAEGYGGKELAAFYVPSRLGLDAAAVRRHLTGQLPSYMIPARIIALEALPVSGTGKVDRAALRSML
jgi:amino acid adenylation domain-containing protein